MPAAKQSARSPCSTRAAIATIGVTSRPFALADQTSCFDPIQPGHLDIHQYQIDRIASPQSDGFPTVDGGQDLVLLPLQQAAGQLAVDLVVLGEQNPPSAIVRHCWLRRRDGLGGRRQFRRGLEYHVEMEGAAVVDDSVVLPRALHADGSSPSSPPACVTA